MTRPRVRPAVASELSAVAEFIATQQAAGDSHVAYLGLDAASITEDLAALEPLGPAGVLVATIGGRIVGTLAAEWDREPPRAWWHGPFASAEDWESVADRLLGAGRALLPEWVTQEELAPDDRHARMAALARRSGFVAEEASVVMARSLDRRDDLEGAEAPGRVPAVPIGDLGTAVDERRAAVVALHDRLFLGAHVPGDRLGEGRDRLVLVAGAREVAGYVVAERQSDGSGYIDFVGVDEAARGAGVGRALVERACVELFRRYGCRDVHLTVRERRGAARRLYRRCGFVEERVVRPWRRGFSFADS